MLLMKEINNHPDKDIEISPMYFILFYFIKRNWNPKPHGCDNGRLRIVQRRTV